MPDPYDDLTDDRVTIPGAWRDDLAARLDPGETVIAWAAPDLSAALEFAESLLVLTDRRLIHARPAIGVRRSSAGELPTLTEWGSFSHSDATELRARDRGGVGLLELVDATKRLACWRYTLDRQAGVRRLVDGFLAVQAGGRPAPVKHETPVCPDCGAALPSAQAVCAVCNPAIPLLKSPLLRLGQFSRPRAGMVILGFALALASTAAGLAPPYITMPLYDRVLIPYQNGDPVDVRLVYWYLGAMLGAAILAWLLSWARSYVLAWVSERIVSDLRNATYAHLQRLSLEFFGGRRTGDLMARLGNDTARLCSFLSDSLVDFGADILMIVGTAIILLTIDPFLAIATLVPFPLIAWMVFRVRGRLRRGFHRSARAWSEITSVLADTERREVERYHASNDRILQTNDRVNTIWTFFWPLVALLTQIGLLVVWGFGTYEVFNNRIKVGVLTAFLAYISRFYIRLESMSRMVQLTQRAGASAQRIFEILDRVPSVPEPARPVHPGRLRGEIELCGVSFRHGNRPILSDINLTIHPGDMIGLVGASGAGKSTLVNLICRFYDVREGAILVDGVDLRSFPVPEYRRNIGLVLQDPFLFFGTIAENIAYGHPEATRDEIVAAARAARCHEFILRLADGYDSWSASAGNRFPAESGSESRSPARS